MTVNTKKITSGPYAGNGVADTFSYGFKVSDKTELSVFETDDNGIQTELVVDVDYIVNSVGNDSGGTITRTAGALPTNYQWYIRSNYEETQLTAFTSQGPFFPDLHENAMDKLTFLIQQILDKFDRSPSLPLSYQGPLPISLPEPVAGEFLRWNIDLNGFENVRLTDEERPLDFINYTSFGAVLDGVTDDTQAVINAHNYANSTGMTVKQDGGVALVNPSVGSIQIRTSCEYTGGFKFRVNGDFSTYPFKVTPEYTETVLNQGDVNLSEFVKHATKLSNLNDYPDHFMVIDSNDVDLNRNHASMQVLKKSVPTLLGEQGRLAYPLTTTFGSISSIRLSPTNIKRVVIKDFVCELTGEPSEGNLIEVTRNCVTFENPRYIDATSNTGQIDLQSFISWTYAYDLEIINPICDALSDGRLDYNYTILTWKCAKLLVQDLRSFEGWAQLDGNYTRDVTVRDSTVDRIGGHFSFWDFTAENVTCVKSRGVDLSGGGRLSVKNLKVIVNEDFLAVNEIYAVEIRGDYAAEWDGDIDINGVTIDARGITSQMTSDKTYNVLNAFADSSSAGFDYGRGTVMAKSISVKNVTFMASTGAFNKWNVRAVATGYTGAPSTNAQYPESITIDNIKLIGKSTGHYHQIIALNYFGALKPPTQDNHCTINISNVNNYDPRIAGENPATGISTQLPVVNVSGLTRNFVKMYISDCDWLKLTADGNIDKMIDIDVNNSRVYYIGGAFQVRYKFNDCVFAATRFEGSWKGVINGGFFEDFLNVDAVTYGSVGFPNELSVNLTAIKGVLIEPNTTIYNDTLTERQIYNGWVNTSYYKDFGYREAAQTPVGNVTPDEVGDEYLDTSAGQFNWYKAVGVTSANWKQIT
ncbi:hypothetical protein PODOV073v1_p0016 [Vibrio phage PS25B.1]|nr:hypothetical protein PODOV073v1_p0016 [Vibrio phage PS25B.1]